MATKSNENIKTDLKFVIDFDSFDKSDLSLNFLIIDKFFETSDRKNMLSLSLNELLKKISEIDKDLDDKSDDHLLKKFVLPGTSLIEAVFRILILNGNKAMSIPEMEENFVVCLTETALECSKFQHLPSILAFEVHETS